MGHWEGKVKNNKVFSSHGILINNSNTSNNILIGTEILNNATATTFQTCHLPHKGAKPHRIPVLSFSGLELFGKV